MKEESDRGLRITQQFRSGRAMVYDLKHGTSRLTLRIFERQSSSEPGDFRVEAASGDGGGAGASAEPRVVTGWGATRAEALRDAGRAWVDARHTPALPSFDWDAVASALRAVRAV